MGASLNKHIFIKENPRLKTFIDECRKSSLPEIDKSTAGKWLDEAMASNFSSSSATDFDRAFLSIIATLQLNFNIKIWELLKYEYLNKHDNITAFTNICRHIGYKPMPKEIASEWFERVYKSKNTDAIHPELQHLIRMVIEADVLFERSFYIGRDYRWNYNFDLGQRYDFGLLDKNEKPQLIIDDRYHNKEARLNSTSLFDQFGSQNTSTTWSFIQKYGNSWLVLRESRDDITSNYLLLLFIDFESSEFNMLQMEMVHTGVVESISFDQKDKQKFAIKMSEYIDNEGYVYFIIFGHVTEDMRIVIDHSQTRITKTWKYEKLCGPKLFSVCRETDEAITYRSINVNDRSIIEEFKLDFNWPVFSDKIPFKHKTSAWFEERCYFQVQEDSCYLLNVETRQCFKLEFLSLVFFYGIKEFEGNEDGCLLLVSDSGFYTIPLRKPLRLENIAFFSIRRYASICGSRVYEQAMQQMPLTSELRPFYDFK